MGIGKSIKSFISDFLWIRSLRIHKSRIGYREAPTFTKYLRHCQRGFHKPEFSTDAQKCIKQFHQDGYFLYHDPLTAKLAQSILDVVRQEEEEGTPIWGNGYRYENGDIFQKFPEVETLLKSEAGKIINGIFGSDFKIFFGVMYKSFRQKGVPEGSQLWHSDGGPGTCINMMFCLNEVSPANGSMECLTFDDSLKIYNKERDAIRRAAANALNTGKTNRELRSDFYKTEIEQNFTDNIIQPTSPPGLIYAFRNNCIHKGGFVESGQERYVIVFHVYPSDAPTPFDKYLESGIGKSYANPTSPDF